MLRLFSMSLLRTYSLALLQNLPWLVVLTVPDYWLISYPRCLDLEEPPVRQLSYSLTKTALRISNLFPNYESKVQNLFLDYLVRVRDAFGDSISREGLQFPLAYLMLQMLKHYYPPFWVSLETARLPYSTSNHLQPSMSPVSFLEFNHSWMDSFSLAWNRSCHLLILGKGNSPQPV